MEIVIKPEISKDGTKDKQEQSDIEICYSVEQHMVFRTRKGLVLTKRHASLECNPPACEPNGELIAQLDVVKLLPTQ